MPGSGQVTAEAGNRETRQGGHSAAGQADPVFTSTTWLPNLKSSSGGDRGIIPGASGAVRQLQSWGTFSLSWDREAGTTAVP